MENEGFNITVPWNEQIANVLGISTEQLTANYKNDSTLYNTIGSTCAMIRNRSLGQVFKNQNGDWAAKQLKEVCYGKGFAMIEGVLHPLGLCTNTKKKVPRSPVLQDNSTHNSFQGECSTKKDAQVTKLNPNAANNQSYDSRLNRMFGKNYLSGLKMGGLKFIQKAMFSSKHVEGHLVNLSGEGQDNVNLNHMSNSLTSIPPYHNSDLNSKGYSFNPTPEERFDNSADQVLQNNGAQDSSRQSKDTAKHTKKTIDNVKRVFQEENKALGGTGPGQSFSGTVAGSFIPMKAPNWLCSVVCAGLDVDEVLDDARIKSKPANSGMNTMFDTVSSSTQEEQDVLNVKKDQINSVAQTEGMYNNSCQNINPSVPDCIKYGEALSSWMMERLLNPGTMCNLDKGECGKLQEKSF